MQLPSLLVLMAVGMLGAIPAQDYITLNKSKPVFIAGLEFMTVVQEQWRPLPSICMRNIEIQLWITNRTDHDIAFRTFDTFAVKVFSEDGSEIHNYGGRDGTLISPSVLIHAGDTYCLSRPATLTWKNPKVPNQLDYRDGTGAWAVFRPLTTGSYTVRFSLESKPADSTAESRKLGGIEVWTGSGETKEAAFNIIEKNG